jgi:hypothetical protein
MKTMRERLASRICCPSGLCENADQQYAVCQAHTYLRTADAILDELRDPDKGMLEAGGAYEIGLNGWQAMIKAARQPSIETVEK